MHRRKVSALIGVVLLTTLTGCTFPKPIVKSNVVDTYSDIVQKDRENMITGTVTLLPDTYVVYSYPGANCSITDFEQNICEVFAERDFIAVTNEDGINVSITDGYLIPLSKAAASNADIWNNGVYMIGFDTIPMMNKMANGQSIEVLGSVPVLFETPNPMSYSTWGTFDATDGMLVKLKDSYLVERSYWDIEANVSKFDEYYKTIAGNGYWSDYDDYYDDTVYPENVSVDLWKVIALGWQDASIIRFRVDNDKVTFTYDGEEISVEQSDICTVTKDLRKYKASGSTRMSVASISEYVEEKSTLDISNSVLWFVSNDNPIEEDGTKMYPDVDPSEILEYLLFSKMAEVPKIAAYTLVPDKTYKVPDDLKEGIYKVDDTSVTISTGTDKTISAVGKYILIPKDAEISVDSKVTVSGGVSFDEFVKEAKSSKQTIAETVTIDGTVTVGQEEDEVVPGIYIADKTVRVKRGDCEDTQIPFEGVFVDGATFEVKEGCIVEVDEETTLTAK